MHTLYLLAAKAGSTRPVPRIHFSKKVEGAAPIATGLFSYVLESMPTDVSTFSDSVQILMTTHSKRPANEAEMTLGLTKEHNIHVLRAILKATLIIRERIPSPCSTNQNDF